MSIGTALEQRKGIVIAVCALGLLLGAGLIYHTATGSSVPAVVGANVFYYDLNTGQPFVRPNAGYAPIRAPSDSGSNTSGLRAHLFSCGHCPDKATHWVGYLEKNTPEALNFILKKEDPAGQFSLEDDVERHGWMVAAGESKSPEWIVKDTGAGRAVIAAVKTRCKATEPLDECDP